jgi:hypothetical protein
MNKLCFLDFPGLNQAQPITVSTITYVKPVRFVIPFHVPINRMYVKELNNCIILQVKERYITFVLSIPIQNLSVLSSHPKLNVNYRNKVARIVKLSLQKSGPPEDYEFEELPFTLLYYFGMLFRIG